MNNKSIIKKLPLVLAVGMATHAIADEAVVENETVQVWSTSINNASSLLSDEIAVKQADHLSDLLRDQPGVDVGGAHSLNQRITIRGLQDLDLDIRIDGANQNNFIYHHTGNLLVNADILKAVDLQVGTNSVLNGGLSGGISFETKDAKDLLRDGQQVGARLHANYGSNDFIGYSTTVYSQLNEQLDVLAYFNSVNRDNPEDGNGSVSLGNDGEIDNTLLKFGLDIDENNRLELSYDNYVDEGDYAPRPDLGTQTNSAITGVVVLPTEYERETLTLNYELDLGDALNLRATLYENELTLSRDERNNPSGGTVNFAHGSSKHTGLNVLAETILDADATTHTLRYGFETYEQKTERVADGVLTRRESADSLAVYAEDEILFENGLELTPGVRYNRYKLDTNASNATFTDTTLGLEATYPLTDNWKVRASATELFQGPGLTEVFVTTIPAANPDLQPETGLNKEIGIAFDDDGLWGLDRTHFSLTLFETDLDDFIDDENEGVLENAADYVVQGFEASFGLSQGNFDARLTYAHSESENQENGEALNREAGDSISLGLDYYLPAYDLGLNWTSLFTLEETFYDKPDYDIHNISANWTPRQFDGLTVTAGVENLFDEAYASHASRIGNGNHPVFGPLVLTDFEPGRNIKLSVSYQF